MNATQARQPDVPATAVLRPRERRRCHVREAFSLLEIILALGLLAMSLATIMEVNRTSLHCAASARDLTKARLLCESKMAEVVAGIMPIESVDEMSFADENYEEMSSDELGDLNDIDTNASLIDAEFWYYSIETLLLDENGLTEIRVSVWREAEGRYVPKPFTLTRWIVDEEAVALMAEGLTPEDVTSMEGGM